MLTIYDVKFTCPDIRNQSDVILIREALAQSPGVDLVEVDIKNHRVHVTTANQDGGSDIRQRLSSAGFPAED